MKNRVPILVGQAQETNHLSSLKEFINPIQLMKKVIKNAELDSESSLLISQADSLHIVNIFSWDHPDFPTAVSEALEIRPPTKEYTSLGGNSPQWLVNRVADRLVNGESEIAILAGCEVARSAALARKSDEVIEGFYSQFEEADLSDQILGSSEVENEHLADIPIRIYPLIENALRAKEKLSLEEQRKNLGRFGEIYSSIAAKNPYAWFPIQRTAEEVVNPTAENRMVSFPYTKYLSAVLEVDQAAAVIMTTTEKARQLGIPESKWVYLQGGQDAHDLWFISEREDLADSPALKAIVQDSLAQADLQLNRINFFDFYSCFPCMPRLSRHVLGIPQNDPRPMTLTGGLPYFGGPGSNYTMHAIAEAIKLCRTDSNLFGMVTANGWYSTKHGVGIYSASEPKKSWQRMSPRDFQRNLKLPKPLEVDFDPQGKFKVDSYTVWHDRNGNPKTGILYGRTEAGKRGWGHTDPNDKKILANLMKEEWIGKVGKVIRRDERVNIVEF